MMFQSPCAAFVASLSLCLAVGQLRLATAYYHGEPGGLSQNGKKSHASIKTMSASASSSRPSKMRYSPNFERTDDDELTYQFGVNTRSTSGNGVSGDESTDSCHLSIECNDNRLSSVKLPIYGPKGDAGPPGLTGLKGDKGEPGIAGIPAREPQPPNFSAFFAALVNNTGPFKQDKDILFTHVITNYGNAYDPRTGVYTAPFRGIYQFVVAISATGGQQAGCSVMHNKQSIMTVWADSQPWSTTSQTLILRLAVNDKVFVRLQARASNLHGYYYSSFGGYLLFEEI